MINLYQSVNMYYLVNVYLTNLYYLFPQKHIYRNEIGIQISVCSVYIIVETAIFHSPYHLS